MNDSNPSRYFDEPQQLEAARAIVAGDQKRLQTALVGLEIDRPGRESMTLLWFAIHERNFDAIRFLISKGSDPQGQLKKGPGLPVEYALLNKDTRILTAMLDGGLSVDHVDPNGGVSLVMKAAGDHSPEIDHLKVLVERGANVNTHDSIGHTPVTQALATYLPDRALYLLEHGANWNTFTTGGMTPSNMVEWCLTRAKPGTDVYRDFERVRDLMAKRGAKFPADDAATVRVWMKTQGMRVVD